MDDMINKGLFKPNWEAQGLSERQVIRRRKQDRKFFAVLLGSLNSDKVQQQWELEAETCSTRFITTAER